ncbi:hypothetical protein FJY63_10385, partial [Candidatus Sumerlaeota bacterium]|nr:hypothetical protein [Candidatus Sumerlaeota bacterium]
DEALGTLATAAQRVETRNETWRRRIAIATGDAYRAKQDCDLARKHYLQAEALQPLSAQDAVARSSYGLTVEAYLARGENAEALAKLQEWAERFPADKIGGYWSLLMGRCFAHLRRYNEAVEELALAARIEPFGAYTRDILEHLGQTHRLQKRYGEAIEALRSAANLLDDPGRKRIIEDQIAQIQREASSKR